MGIIWHRNMMPTISIHANVKAGVLGNAKTKEVYKSHKTFAIPCLQAIPLNLMEPLKERHSCTKSSNTNANYALCDHDNPHISN